MLHFARKSGSHRVEHAALHFREQTSDIVHERGRLLTVAVLASQFAVFVLVVLCVRAAGIPAGQVSFLAVLLSFSIARLAGALPLTPGGLGSVDAAFTGMLIAFGATPSAALAADLIWRAATYFPPIFIGIVTYVCWRRGLANGTYTKEPDLRPAAADRPAGPWSGPGAISAGTSPAPGHQAERHAGDAKLDSTSRTSCRQPSQPAGDGLDQHDC